FPGIARSPSRNLTVRNSITLSLYATARASLVQCSSVRQNGCIVTLKTRRRSTLPGRNGSLCSGECVMNCVLISPILPGKAVRLTQQGSPVENHGDRYGGLFDQVGTRKRPSLL